MIAALGEPMVNVAGEHADGTTVGLIGPKTLADHMVTKNRAAAEPAGRPLPRVVANLGGSARRPDADLGAVLQG